MMFLKNCIRKIVYGSRASSDSLIKYLREKGMSIGEDVHIYNPRRTMIDETRPWLIHIGNHVNITEGCTILTHGYDWSVLKAVYGDILGSSGGVSIGDNVFIGMNTTILKGVHIGNNVIIGAASLVNKDIPDNVVAAGNPCHVICTLEEYHEKRKNAQVKEATELVLWYREAYRKEPNEKALHEFFWLFSDDPDFLPPVWDSMMKLMGNYDFSRKVLKKNKKQFKDMDEFLKKV